jgi:hypothetical protein
MLEEKVKELSDELDARQIIEQAQQSQDGKVLRLEAEIDSKSQEIQGLERSCLKYKTLLDEKYKDCERLRHDYEKVFCELVITKER